MADPTDDELRSALQAAFDRPAGAEQALDRIRPGMARARRGRRLITGLATATAALLLATGAGAMMGSVEPDTDPVATRPAPYDPETAVPIPSSTVTTTIESHREPDPAVTTTSTVPTPSPGPTSSERPPTTSPITTAAPPTEPAPGPASPPSSSAPPGTQSPSTTTTSPAPPPTTAHQYVVDSACGSITVAVSGGRITLIDTSADPGMGTDVKNSGPETVEVSFEGEGGHCEIKAEWRDGQLWTDVESE